MKRKRLTVMVALFVGLIFLAGIAFSSGEKMEEIKVINKIVTVSGYEGAQPNTITSEPGTTVIWVNQDRQPVEILFFDKKVVLACGSPVNFFIGKAGAYESGKISFGGTASLCFIEKGKYEYMVTSSRTFFPLGKDKKHQGVIWIK
jgi:plastocyanin